MWKYIKVSLVLFLTAVICALGVAGVNYITSPIIEEHRLEQKLKAYKEIFPDFDSTKSEIITSGFKSSYIKEKVVVRSADKDLGYAFNVSGVNQYGIITLVTGFDTTGNLLNVVVTENGQTAGRAEKINAWISETFVSGMTPTEIDKAPIKAEATKGSNLVKSLLNACLSELGIKTEIQKDLEKYFGESVDMSKSINKGALIYPQQISDFYTVKDSKNTILGYFARVNQTEVVLNNQFEVLTENPNVKYVELVKAEAENRLDEKLFVELILTTNPTFEDQKFDKKFERIDKVQSVSKDNKFVGKVVKVLGTVKVFEEQTGSVGLFLVFNSNDNLEGVAIYENTQSEGMNESVSNFVGSSFCDGMNGTEALSQSTVAGATIGTNLVLDLVADAFEVLTGTRPEKPVEGYDKYYLQAFEGVDLSKSVKLTEFASDLVKEGFTLKDAKENELGKAFVVEGQNQYGTIKLLVAVNKDGSLAKYVTIHMGQSEGRDEMLNNWMSSSFKPGMSLGNVSAVKPEAQATIGSNLIKDLIKAALESAGNKYNDHYLAAFPTLDLNKSVELTKFNNSQILSGLEAKDKDGKVLGKAYIVRIENGYAYHIFMVAINDNKLVKVTDVENDHHGKPADITPQLEHFKPGMTLEQINGITEAKATFTIEQISLGIKVAFAEYNSVVSDTLSDELNVKELFPLAVWGSTKLMNVDKVPNIIKGFEVFGCEGYDNKVKHIGYAYVVKIENQYSIYEIMVALNTDKTYSGAKVISYENKREIIQPGFLFKDETLGEVNKYLATFTKGMNLGQIENHTSPYGLGYTSNLIKAAIKVAMLAEEKNPYVVTESYLNNIDEYYLLTFDGISLRHSEIIETKFKDKNVLEGLIARDNKGNLLGVVYLIKNNNIYSHNIIMVALNLTLDKNNKVTNITLHNFVDVETDHAKLQDINNRLTSGMTYDEVNNLVVTGSTFSVEQVKEVIKIAMIECGAKDTGVLFEQTTKSLYPLMIAQKSARVNTKYNTYIKEGYVVRGIEPYGKDIKLLGYTYLLEVNGNKVVFNVNADLVLTTKYVVLEQKTKGLDTFLAQIKEGITAEEIDKLTNITNEDLVSNNFKVALKDLLNEKEIHKPLTAYDTFVLKAFPEYFSQNSSLIKGLTHSEILTAVEVKDINKSLLGYAYVVKLTNLWSEGNNVMLVKLDQKGNYVSLTDIEQHHAAMEGQNKFFENCDTIEDVNNVLASHVSGGTMSLEMAALGIKIALNEHHKTGDLLSKYESSVKVAFPGMITKHSETFTNLTNKTNILTGYFVKGAVVGNYDKNNELGYSYLVNTCVEIFDVTLAVHLSLDRKTIISIDLIEFKEQNPTVGGNLTTKLNDFLKTFANTKLADHSNLTNDSFYLNILVEQALNVVEAELDSKVYTAPTTLNDYFAKVYTKSYQNIDLCASKLSEVKDNENILHMIEAIDNAGNLIGKGYVVVVANPYSKNFILVMLNPNGSLQGLVDVQNDHANISGSMSHFKPGMTLEEIYNIQTSGGTYTVDEMKLAVKIAMTEFNKEYLVSLKEELAIKELFPMAITEHSKKFITTGASTYTYQVRGTKYYKNNQLLGYVSNLKLSNLEVLLVRGNNGELFAQNKVVILDNKTNVDNELIIKFFAKYQTNITTKEEILANNTGLDSALVDEINNALISILPISKGNSYYYDFYLLEGLNNVCLANTKVLTPKQTEVLFGYEAYDANNNKLGYGFILQLEQKWGEGPNIFLVVLGPNGEFLNLVDIYNNHASVGGSDIPLYAGDKNQTDVMESLNGFFNSEHSSGTMSHEIAGLGIMIAMNEVLGVNNEVRYESLAKKMFNGMITCKSDKLTNFTDSTVKFGYKVIGADYGKYPHVGNVYFLDNGTTKLAVGIDVDGNIVKVYNMTNLKEVELTEYAGLDKAKVETLQDSEVKSLVLKVFGLGGNK